MTKVAIYARYSSDLQSDASIEDQIRIAEQRAEREGWSIYNRYTDHGISGASMMRPGIQMLMQDAASGKFDIVLAEALDRLSRDQEDVAGIYKRTQFAGVKIITISEGEITNLHIGLKGTMNAMFLKDLADKTRRGLSGRVEKGLSGGGLTYGYDVIKKFDATGEPIKGERSINPSQAAIVNRIFQEYVEGKSPMAIAHQLNKEHIPCPTGGTWGPSTINGCRERGTGILNNELYIGMMVWNRKRYVKNPDTGKRVSRMNPESEWIHKEVPELRIIDQALWDKAKERQGENKKKKTEYWGKRRPSNLLSYLLKCGVCEGGFCKSSKTHYSCSTARNKGTCSNRMTIRQDVLEEAVLKALRTHLMNPALVEIYCQEYTRHLKELRLQRNTRRRAAEMELNKLQLAAQNMVEAIANGLINDALVANLNKNDARQKELKSFLSTKVEEKILLHPSMAHRYRKEVTALVKNFNNEEHRSQAAEIIRSLINKIVLTPKQNNSELSIDLIGDLAGILKIAVEHNATNEELQEIQAQIAEMTENLEIEGFQSKQVKDVAGAGFEPATFGL
jgi:site-specific DNA recombinase